MIDQGMKKAKRDWAQAHKDAFPIYRPGDIVILSKSEARWLNLERLSPEELNRLEDEALKREEAFWRGFLANPASKLRPL